MCVNHRVSEFLPYYISVCHVFPCDCEVDLLFVCGCCCEVDVFCFQFLSIHTKTLWFVLQLIVVFGYSVCDYVVFVPLWI
jgi:hypothetical protein